MENKKHYCTVENDGVAVCVCKHSPCEQLKRKEQALDEIERILNTRNEQGRGFCDTRLPLILDIVNKTKEQ